MTAFVTALQLAHAAGLRGAWRNHLRAAADPERIQAERLTHILRRNAGSEFGRSHAFSEIEASDGFQSRVPVMDYDAYEPWIERAARGEAAVLTGEPVRMFERSGGSTATNKLIPYTDGLLAEFSQATDAWLYDLYMSIPALWGTRSYWSLSPATRQGEKTGGGLPIGFEDDTQYFGPLVRWALRRMMAVPGSVARIPDMQTWRRTTLLHLLSARDLGLISVWSPTFLTLLMGHLEDCLDEMLPALKPGRADEIRRACDRAGALRGEDIWPRLALISCWTDATSSEYLPRLRAYFPQVCVQPKGLLATEGVVSFPLWGRAGSVIAASAHFLEFIDLQRPSARPLLVHQLRAGGQYSPLLTTSGGLYRYHLKDVIHCVGHERRLPLIRFAGKLDQVADLCGEKLNLRQVERGLDLARRQTGLVYRFALLAPNGDGPQPFYQLFVETEADEQTLHRFADLLEAHLATGHHYRYCLELGQLARLRVSRIRDGWATYEQTLLAAGLRAGDIKPCHLDTRPIWAEAFGSICAPLERRQSDG